VYAVELDRGLAEALKTWPEAETGELKVINQDILKLNLSQLGQTPFTVVGNLPYNLSTPILFWFLAQTPLAQAGVFMLQKEMAERLLAQPGQDSYGRLSVALSLWAEVKQILAAPPEAFQPKPKVHSAVVSLIPQKAPEVSLKALGHLTKAAFHARRKTLANNLFPVYGREKSLAALAQLAVDPGLRAETLAPKVFAEMAKLLVPDPDANQLSKSDG
jgi:16S rRNA (adenine1518-N6/adenine1519-N6)-dimethyltransferase